MHKHWISDLSDRIAQDPELPKFTQKALHDLFPRSYRDDFDVEEALLDLRKLIRAEQEGCLQVRLTPAPGERAFAIKLYALCDAVTLSQSMSILESMGLEVLMEKPYRLNLNGKILWLHHFSLGNFRDPCVGDSADLPGYFEQLYRDVWLGRSENDAFNSLLFSTCLPEADINLLRAYSAYLHQIQFPYSRALIIETLNAHPRITLKLVRLFHLHFDPDQRADEFATLREEYLTDLNEIDSLDQDRIFKQLLSLIEATVRTNFFQSADGWLDYLSFKFESSLVAGLPEPHPLYEIFVYSARFEGIHLRGGKVARGGIRWSDRKEDYRTEVLGLMKAQMIKNAVIVPAGSKGGFVTKRIAGLDRDQSFAEVKACYELYIQSLLELTDNIVHGEVVHPVRTRIYDEPDPYLVVAADKGTASFSDTANAIALRLDYWLQDAFASGGSSGYDHKKMGITARGAWESVKRHFRVLGRDIQSEPFSVVGIGDMSGDVFGNGMLLSRQIRLVAAFNHLHIFIDPDPDIEASYAERERLFKLPRSGWNDYNRKLISKGGGVFSRRQKKIAMSEQMKALTGSQQDSVTPDELIRLLLKAPVDLLWNGGIGTYVKSERETNADVMDKANDALRVNGRELRVKVVGEGGNLGFTQLGRIEYAMHGGLIYTDSIDNSAGVDCSDHEVNIKIAFSRMVLRKDMTMEERNRLLEDMTDEVAELCLRNNYSQTQIIDIILMQSPELMHEHRRFIRHLENQKVLKRQLEYLPDEDEITERIARNQGLTAPEISILLPYSKLFYKNALLASEIAEESFAQQVLLDYFPEPMRAPFREEILSHPLKREIIATQLSNQVIDQIGAGFGFKMREETGANIVSIARAHQVCKTVLDIDPLWERLQQLDCKINENQRYQAFRAISGLLERSISWMLRYHPGSLDVEQLIERYHADCRRLRKVLPHALSGQARRTYTRNRRQYLKQGFPEDIAQELAENSILAAAFDIIEIRLTLRSHTENTAKLFFALSERLQLDWIREQISETNVRNHWHQLAVVNMRNTLHRFQRELAQAILQAVPNKRHTTKALRQWLKQYDYAIRRYDQMLAELQALRKLDFTMASVAAFEVRRLLELTARK